ncbi:MAG: hypothetical protein K2Q21_15370 [Chitinophagaceae bacterium]|nr:hypothetical protein [Chitinophagaceae bacterium]
MKKLILPLLTIILFTTISCSSCKKEILPEFYFHCNVNGQEYIPNNCANCRVAKLLGDTTFLINGNRGFETISIGIIKLDRININIDTYGLDGRLNQNGIYKNSTTVSDKYITDSTHTGNLTILSLDKTNKIISGTFSFNGYNSVQNNSVSITEGVFRLEYTTN